MVDQVGPETKAASEMKLVTLPRTWTGAARQKQLKFKELEKSLGFKINSILIQLF